MDFAKFQINIRWAMSLAVIARWIPDYPIIRFKVWIRVRSMDLHDLYRRLRAWWTPKRWYWRAYRELTEMGYSPPIRAALEGRRSSMRQVKSWNHAGFLAVAFESEYPDVHYFTSAIYDKVQIGAQFSSGDQVIDCLNWFRAHGYKSQRFHDSEHDARYYTMIHIHDPLKPSFVFGAHFSSGECRFVETGKVLEIKPEEKVMERKLVCGDIEVPEAV